MFNEMITKDEVKFNELEKKIFKFVCFLGCMLIKLFLERYDEKLKNSRDKSKYRHKGSKENTVRTVMGPVTYKRTMYIENDNGKTRYMFLLDEKLKICSIGNISQNLAETAVEVVVNSTSYRKASENIESMTNESISHEALRTLTVEIGEKIEQKEKEEISLMKKGQLVKGLKEIAALFEEADGIWINLQGKDRQEALEKQKKKCEKQGKKFNSKTRIKAELKLHVMYEGWEKGDKRHTLVNKRCIAGIMSPQRIKELRDARVYQMYDVDKIKLRVTNGDGAAWTKGTTAKGGIYQKDNFHIHQEITRDVPKEYRNIIEELVEKKDYSKIAEAIERLKYELGGEVTAVRKLKALKSYLKQDLERYQDVLEAQGKEIPEAPEGIEYRNMGTQESQIFSKLKVRLCSGRKSFSKYGANALSKVCVWVKEKEEWYEDLEEAIPMDTSVEDWIEEIESKIVKRNRNVGLSNQFVDMTNCKTGSVQNAPQYIRNILKEIDIIDMKCSF
jgi:hypothetical protein